MEELEAPLFRLMLLLRFMVSGGPAELLLTVVLLVKILTGPDLRVLPAEPF